MIYYIYQTVTVLARFLGLSGLSYNNLASSRDIF